MPSACLALDSRNQPLQHNPATTECSILLSTVNCTRASPSLPRKDGKIPLSVRGRRCPRLRQNGQCEPFFFFRRPQQKRQAAKLFSDLPPTFFSFFFSRFDFLSHSSTFYFSTKSSSFLCATAKLPHWDRLSLKNPLLEKKNIHYILFWSQQRFACDQSLPLHSQIWLTKDWRISLRVCTVCPVEPLHFLWSSCSYLMVATRSLRQRGSEEGRGEKKKENLAEYQEWGY